MMDSTQNPPPPNYVMLNPDGTGIRPPPTYSRHHHQRRNIPRYHSHRSKTSCCFKCICFCYCLLCLLIFTLVGILSFAYTLYKPKVPSYKVADFAVTKFDTLPDLSIYTEIQVIVEANNPNEKIGFIYGKNSTVSISFQDSILCSGKLPAFHQGHNNVSMIKIQLTGKSAFGSGLHEAYIESERKGRIPLLVQVDIPIRVVVDEIPLRKCAVTVNCSMEVDNLKPDKKPRILSTDYKFSVSF